MSSRRSYNGARVVWTNDLIEELISEVRPYRYLYDLMHPDYKNQRKKDDTCRVQKKWQYLRDKYQKELKVIEKAKSGSAAHQKRPWVFFKLMSFLRGYVSSRRRTIYDKRAHACSEDRVAEATSYAEDSAKAAILQDLVEQYSGQHSRNRLPQQYFVRERAILPHSGQMPARGNGSTSRPSIHSLTKHNSPHVARGSDLGQATLQKRF
ncbi:hypothetical protein MTO96_035013 [Rhipicephalus appendiculatus]